MGYGHGNWKDDLDLYDQLVFGRRDDHRSKKPGDHIWVTKDDRRIHVDKMSVDHVRNTLKLILRLAHEGQVWAISPETGGLRHYTKETIVAKATVTKVPPKVVSAYENINSITLEITPEEAKALVAVGRHTYPDTVGGKALNDIKNVLLNAGLSSEDQDITWAGSSFSGVRFKR